MPTGERIKLSALFGRDGARLVEPQPGFPREAWPGWVGERRGFIAEQLDRHGALLFRGFGVDHASGLDDFCRAAGYTLMDYPRGISPRHVVEGRVYTATDIPPRFPLPLHNEMSYTSTYPLLVAFCCEQEPTHRGETPIADMGRVIERISPDSVERFERHGILYLQRLPSDRSRTGRRSWQQTFATEDPDRVREICGAQGIELEWGKTDDLHLRSVRPAVLIHPRTGGRIWFNQAHIFHRSFADELRHDRRWLVGAGLRAYETAQQRLGTLLPGPFDCRYGDGTPIPRATMLGVRRAIWRETRSFGWRRGDLLLLDNLRIAHGRAPYRGERRVLAALIEAAGRDEARIPVA